MSNPTLVELCKVVLMLSLGCVVVELGKIFPEVIRVIYLAAKFTD